MNVLGWLGLEHVYYNVAVQFVNYYDMGTTSC